MESRDEQDFWEAAHERQEQLLQRLGGLLELPMRQAQLRLLLTSVDPEEACWHMGQILRGALWGRNPHIDAMLACSLWLIQERAQGNFTLFEDLFRAAHTSEREEILHLLRDPPPHRALLEGSRLPEVRLPIERDVSLGERRSMARGSNRVILERLLMDPSELVIQKLLDNPAIQMPDLLVIASRRPTRAEILTSIATHTRWMRQHDVREALVRNPFTPTGISLRLLPTLHSRIINQIKNSGDLHPLLPPFAELLLRLRSKRLS